MRHLLFCILACILAFNFSNCRQKSTPLSDTPSSGTIDISVDESFAPVIGEALKVYHNLYPNSNIIAHYKPEADCLRDFFFDSSNRLIIIARGLTDEEDELMHESLNYTPGWNQVAFDAIAVIVPSGSSDTLFSKEGLKDILTGKEKGRTVVFDGLRATSTIRYVRDSILQGSVFDTSVVKAADGSQMVMQYVATHKNAIGLIGISWIGNPEDAEQLQWLKKIDIARVRCDACDGMPYVKPTQQSISTGRYPLVRGLYYIIKENYQGLGNGFVSFLKFEQGQLIFRRAYLRPMMNFDLRNVTINESALSPH